MIPSDLVYFSMDSCTLDSFITQISFDYFMGHSEDKMDFEQ